jgi:hypothetical protein
MRRGVLTPQQIRDIGSDACPDLMELGAPCCELAVGGETVARGRIVKRRGAWYFRVMEMEETV